MPDDMRKAPSGDALGDRMKSYEMMEAGRRFMHGLPVVARIDGRSFSSFTRGLERPYDVEMSRAMVETTRYLVDETHALIGYTQSDEITLVFHAPEPKSEIFFDGRVLKLASVLAGLATAKFNDECLLRPRLGIRRKKSFPVFDARVWQLPSLEEAANAVLWRVLDATKNAISMAARAHYPHKALHGRTGAEMQEMLFQKGVNFNDFPAFFKRGTFVRRTRVERRLTAEELQRIPEKHRPPADVPVTRAAILEIEMPVFSKVLNRVQVIFEGAAPRTAGETVLLPADASALAQALDAEPGEALVDLLADGRATSEDF